MDGWIEPPNPEISGEYWLTRRNADAVNGYGGFSNDKRVKYRWIPHARAWRTKLKLFDGMDYVGLHSNNGWRIDPDQSDEQLKKCDLADIVEGLPERED